MGLIARAAERLIRGTSEDIVGAISGGYSKWETERGVESWSKPEYAEYIAKSVGVYACVKARADALARPPLRIYQANRDGSTGEVGDDHPARRLLDSVNPFWTRGRLWRATETSLSLSGQAFWGIATASGNPVAVPTELYWLNPSRMKVVPGRDRYIQGFLMQNGDGSETAFQVNEIFWLPYFNPLNEFTGLSPIAAARLSIETSIDAQRSNRALLQNQAVPRGVIVRKGVNTFTAEQADELRQRWAKAMKGPDNAGRVAVLWGDTEYQSIALSPDDLQYIEGQRLTLQDVCRIYQVPPPLVADLERATYSNTDQLVRFFYSSWLISELNWLTEELNERMLPRFGRGLSCAFDTSEIPELAEDETARVDRQIKAIQSGRRTINECRREDGEDDVPWGDVWWAPFNLTPVSDADVQEPATDDGRAEQISVDTLRRMPRRARDFAGAYQVTITANTTTARRSLDRFFAEQSARVLKRVDDTPDAAILDADDLLPVSEDDALDAVLEPVYRSTVSDILSLVDTLFSTATASRPAPSFRTPVAVGEAATGVNGHGAPVAVDPEPASILDALTRAPSGEDDPVVVKILRESSARVRMINDVTRQAIRETIAAGYDAGYGRFQIANGVPADGFVGLRDIVDEFYQNRALTIARTETAWSANSAAADRYRSYGSTDVDILDGLDCGWVSHDDPDSANGSRRTLNDLIAYPIAHPNCVRVPIPVV